LDGLINAKVKSMSNSSKVTNVDEEMTVDTLVKRNRELINVEFKKLEKLYGCGRCTEMTNNALLIQMHRGLADSIR